MKEVANRGSNHGMHRLPEMLYDRMKIQGTVSVSYHTRTFSEIMRLLFEGLYSVDAAQRPATPKTAKDVQMLINLWLCVGEFMTAWRVQSEKGSDRYCLTDGLQRSISMALFINGYVGIEMETARKLGYKDHPDAADDALVYFCKIGEADLGIDLLNLDAEQKKSKFLCMVASIVKQDGDVATHRIENRPGDMYMTRGCQNKITELKLMEIRYVMPIDLAGLMSAIDQFSQTRFSPCELMNVLEFLSKRMLQELQELLTKVVNRHNVQTGIDCNELFGVLMRVWAYLNFGSSELRRCSGAASPAAGPPALCIPGDEASSCNTSYWSELVYKIYRLEPERNAGTEATHARLSTAIRLLAVRFEKELKNKVIQSQQLVMMLCALNRMMELDEAFEASRDRVFDFLKLVLTFSSKFMTAHTRAKFVSVFKCDVANGLRTVDAKAKAQGLQDLINNVDVPIDRQDSRFDLFLHLVCDNVRLFDLYEEGHGRGKEQAPASQPDRSADSETESDEE